MLMGILSAQLSLGHAESVPREQIIPILAATTGESAIGIIVYLVVAFEEGTGRSGLHVIFHTAPGRFSLLMQTAILKVVLHIVQSLDLSPDSWTVALTVPYPDVTIGGDSLFGMVMLSVAALVATNAANV
jgi:hypothetical protein